MKRIPIECYEILSNKLNYNDVTGDFTWIKAPRKYMKDGQLAGCIQGWGYRQFTCKFKGKIYQPRAHILAWYMYYGELPNGFIDHIDRDKDNNSISNLRDVDRSLNGLNRDEYKNKKNPTGCTGVYLINGLYRSTITYKGKLHQLGLYKTREEAIKVRLDSEIKYYGRNFNKSVKSEGFQK